MLESGDSAGEIVSYQSNKKRSGGVLEQPCEPQEKRQRTSEKAAPMGKVLLSMHSLLITHHLGYNNALFFPIGPEPYATWATQLHDGTYVIYIQESFSFNRKSQMGKLGLSINELDGSILSVFEFDTKIDDSVLEQGWKRKLQAAAKFLDELYR
jgi:hypothetical protein